VNENVAALSDFDRTQILPDSLRHHFCDVESEPMPRRSGIICEKRLDDVFQLFRASLSPDRALKCRLYPNRFLVHPIRI